MNYLLFNEYGNEKIEDTKEIIRSKQNGNQK